MRAIGGVRFRNLLLGKQVLCQLSYYRRCHVYLATWLNFSVVLIRGRTNDAKNVNAGPQREGHRGTYTMNESAI